MLSPIRNLIVAATFLIALSASAISASATPSPSSGNVAVAPPVADGPAEAIPVPAPVLSEEAPAVPIPPAPAAPIAAPAVHPWIPVGAAAEPAGNGSGSDDDDWQASFQIYGFLSAVNGELRARDVVVDVDRSFGDISDVLKFAVGLRFDVQKDKWGFAFDNNYMHLGDDVETEQRIVPDYRFDLAINVTEVEGTYRLYRTGSQDDPVGGPRFAIDALGGVRIVHQSTDIELRRRLAPDSVRDASATYVHGYLGNRFVVAPSKYVALIGRYNLSLASDLSWFVNGTVEIRPWEHVAFGAGLQVLDLSLENDSSETAVDARFFGPVFYLKFHF